MERPHFLSFKFLYPDSKIQKPKIKNEFQKSKMKNEFLKSKLKIKISIFVEHKNAVRRDKASDEIVF